MYLFFAIYVLGSGRHFGSFIAIGRQLVFANAVFILESLWYNVSDDRMLPSWHLNEETLQ